MVRCPSLPGLRQIPWRDVTTRSALRESASLCRWTRVIPAASSAENSLAAFRICLPSPEGSPGGDSRDGGDQAVNASRPVSRINIGCDHSLARYQMDTVRDGFVGVRIIEGQGGVDADQVVAGQARGKVPGETGQAGAPVDTVLPGTEDDNQVVWTCHCGKRLARIMP